VKSTCLEKIYRSKKFSAEDLKRILMVFVSDPITFNGDVLPLSGSMSFSPCWMCVS
jgi:hypothetical protein